MNANMNMNPAMAARLKIAKTFSTWCKVLSSSPSTKTKAHAMTRPSKVARNHVSSNLGKASALELAASVFCEATN